MSYTHLMSTLILLLGFQAQTAWLSKNGCRKCMTNGGYCLDQKRYYRCTDIGVLPDLSRMYECADNEVCSMQGQICVDRSVVVESNIACEEGLPCDMCPEVYEWPPGLTCVSSTEYRVCLPEGAIGKSIQCPAGSQCSQQGYLHTGRICLPAAVVQELEFKVTCAEADSQKILPAHQDLVGSCENFNATKNIECFNVENIYDAECKSFIKCQRSEGSLKASVENCAEGLYYNETDNECVKQKPSNCGDF